MKPCKSTVLGSLTNPAQYQVSLSSLMLDKSKYVKQEAESDAIYLQFRHQQSCTILDKMKITILLLRIEITILSHDFQCKYFLHSIHMENRKIKYCIVY